MANESDAKSPRKFHWLGILIGLIAVVCWLVFVHTFLGGCAGWGMRLLNMTCILVFFLAYGAVRLIARTARVTRTDEPEKDRHQRGADL